MSGLLEAMATAGGAIALIDRLAENPKRRNVRKNNPFPGVPTNESDAQAVWEQLRAELQLIAPYVAGYVSTLGGAHRASILFTVSFDPRDTWANGILENSRHGKFHWENDGTLSKISGYGTEKMRKSKAKSVADVVRKVASVAPAKTNPIVIRDSAGRAIKRSENLRGILDYTRQRSVWVERIDLFGPNKQGGGTAGFTWNTGATALADFQDFSVMEDWVKARAKGKRALWGANVIRYAEQVASNPRGRSKRSVTRVSQATGKRPTRRLIARRVKTLRAPAGLYANPVAPPVYFGLHFDAGHDVNGNPRRVIVFLRHNGDHVSTVKAVREDYGGVHGALVQAGLDARTTPIIGRFNVTASEYRNLLKIQPGIAY